jgi:hypothetical protein
MKIFWAFLIAIFIVGFAFPAFGQNEATPLTLKIAKIRLIENHIWERSIIIPINISESAIGVSSLDLRIGYNSEALQLIDVHPGSFLKSRGIASFDYHLRPNDINEVGYPSGLVRIIAKLDSGAIDSNLILDPRNANNLINLEFSIGPDSLIDWNQQPLDFFWTGCGDNVIYSYSGDSILISRNIFDTAGVNITNDTLLPTGAGAPTICLTGLPRDYDKTVIRVIDFRNGGINIDSMRVKIWPFDFKIGLTEPALQGDTVYVPVIKTTGTELLAGFNFLAAYDTSALEFLAAVPGEIFDIPGEYEWSYFDYRVEGNVNYYDTAATGLVRVVGMDDPFYRESRSIPPRLPNGITLFYLKFVVSNNPAWEGIFIPVQFYWDECGDNTVTYYRNFDSLLEPIKYAISDTIYNHLGQPINQLADFPTFYGANNSCIAVSSERPIPTRFINFTNGGVDAINDEPIDAIGDINLNGIQYEYADALLFAEYFVRGLSVFTINERAQTAASDINQDGAPLMLDDFQYMARMIHDGYLPSPGLNFSGTVAAIPEYDKLKIITNLEKPGGAILLTFLAPDSGVVVTVGADVAWDMRYHYSGDTLKVLVFDLAGDSIGAGPKEILNLYFGGPGPKLVDAIAAGYNGDGVNLQIIEQIPFSIKIGKLEYVLPGDYALVPIIKTAGQDNIWGFDFLFAYDADALTFWGAIAGDAFTIPGDYEWEYFTYRNNLTPCSGCPSGMLRVVGMADQNDGAHHPIQKKLPDNLTLFTLNFVVSDNPLYECQSIPIWFIWTSCADNGIAFSRDIDPAAEIKFAISDNVYGWEGNKIDFESSFPTLGGANASCFPNPSSQPSAEKYINFYNGCIDVVCTDTIDPRGDINLNGISNEIGDAYVFSQYFLNGLSAFTIAVSGQIAATDVNGDGIVLSVADFQYLIRIINGVAYHLPPTLIYDADYEIIDKYDDQLTIAVHSDSAIGCLYFNFNVPDSLISIVPRPEISSMEFNYTLKDRLLRILIYSFELNSITANDTMPLFDLNYSGTKPEFISIEGAALGGEKIRFNQFLNSPSGNDDLSPSELPKNFSLDQNWPNPFNLSTEIQFALPSKSEWTMDIFNIQGQKIRTFSGFDPAGQINILWDGTDKSGSVQPSGIYLYRLRAGQFADTKKMILIK